MPSCKILQKQIECVRQKNRRQIVDTATLQRYNKSTLKICRCSLVVELQLPKLAVWVRFPSSAPKNPRKSRTPASQAGCVGSIPIICSKKSSKDRWFFEDFLFRYTLAIFDKKQPFCLEKLRPPAVSTAGGLFCTGKFTPIGLPWPPAAQPELLLFLRAYLIGLLLCYGNVSRVSL